MSKPKPNTSLPSSSKLSRPPQTEQVLDRIRNVLDSISGFYGFEKIHTAVVEDAKIFNSLSRAGLLMEAKHMVVYKNKAGENIALRPSTVLGVLQAYSAHELNEYPHPLKLSADADSFSAEVDKTGDGPVSHTEFSLVMIGEESAVAEAEILHIICRALTELGISTDDLEIKINAVGCGGCKNSFKSALASYQRGRAVRLCKRCKKNIKDRPMNIFLCAEEKCKIVAGSAPSTLDFLCEACKKYLRTLLEFLDEAGIPYILDAKFFKEGSFYNNILFEIAGNISAPESGEEKQQKFTVAEGGCVSRAAEIFYGRKLDVAEGTVKLELLGVVLAKKGLAAPEAESPKVFLVQLGDLAKRKTLPLLEILRASGIRVKESLGRDAIKSQLNVAEKINAETALILGQKEALDKTIIVRDVKSGIQETIPQAKLVDFLKRKLNKQD